MVKGISLYLGMDRTLEENLKLMEEAAQLGYTKVFLSLHIPEADAHLVEKDLGTVVKTAHQLGMAVIGDVDAQKQISGLIDEVRLDDGFTPEDIAHFMTENEQQKIVLNASTIGQRYLDELQDAGVPFARLAALHNFYPRPHTGLSEGFFQGQNALLHAYGIPVGAFLPSQQGKRGPFHLGLPTLEKDRNRPFQEGAAALAASGIESIIIGDDAPSLEELKSVPAIIPTVLVLPLEEVRTDSWAQTLLTQVFTVRPDEAQDVVRALESRKVAHDLTIEPSLTEVRPLGTVTVDNVLGGRYKGELEIVRNPLPAAPEVNVVGRLSPEGRNLLPYLKPGKKFTFQVKK